MRTASLLFSLAAAVHLAAASPSLYPGDDPGSAQARATASEATLANSAFTATYKIEGSAVTFGGLTAADGTPLIEGGTPLFTIHLKNGKTLDSTNMEAGGLSITDSVPDVHPRAAAKPARHKGAPRHEGQQVLHCDFTAPDGSFSVSWNGILANGSHYLRHSMTLTAAKKPVEISKVTALDYNAGAETGTPTLSGNTSHGCVVVNNKLFFGLETPMSTMTAGGRGASSDSESTWSLKSWNPETFGTAFNMPASFRKAYGSRYAATEGPVLTHLKQAEGPVMFAKAGRCDITFLRRGGSQDLHLVGVQLLDSSGQVLSEDVHEAAVAARTAGATYSVEVPEAGAYRLRYWAQIRNGDIDGWGRLTLSLPLGAAKTTATHAKPSKVQGEWKREARLTPERPWTVTSVAGLLAPGQQRRSFLAYLERERAVPYRPFVHYNDWYEIGIRLHDNQDPRKRTTESMWMKLLDIWHKELYVKRKTKIDGFIVDDGWDDFNSLWDFHCGFPNGFSKLSKKARKQGAGMGTWLGPVGGYGSSKQMRISYWNHKHSHNKIDNFQLSNPEYFNAFVGRCRKMTKDYNMRYFKFDGISTKFHAMGPENIEDAEGILNVIRALRETKPSLYINTTVGTWASPFWLCHSDAIWRQENDFDQAGNAGDERDRWITYRDRLVHEVYVKGAPLCPINSIMTHGTIITRNGPPKVMSTDPENCRKEMRMAFGCGSSLQEIYADSDLLSQKGGVLWDELAACIAWVRRNADVLPDVHWVGGSPWNGYDGNIYGYAAWNREKATLTLRNSSAKDKELKATLRELLDVPPGVKGSVTFRNSFEGQRELGLTEGAVDVDASITITMKPLEVIVLEGSCAM